MTIGCWQLVLLKWWEKKKKNYWRTLCRCYDWRNERCDTRLGRLYAAQLALVLRYFEGQRFQQAFCKIWCVTSGKPTDDIAGLIVHSFLENDCLDKSCSAVFWWRSGHATWQAATSCYFRGGENDCKEWFTQGRSVTRRVRGHNSPGAESLRDRRKVQTMSLVLLQYSKFTFE